MAQTREERLTKQREWRARNKERISAYNKAYAKANPDRVKAKQRRYVESHREDLARKQRERMAAMDPEERRKVKREEYERNIEQRRAYNKRRYAENAEDEKRKARQWVLDNPERRRAYREAYRPRARELYWLNREKALTYMHRRRGVRSDPDELAVIAHDPCVYCNGPADTIDHIHPIIAGGGGEWENLAAACRSCNSAKCDTPLLHFLLKDAYGLLARPAPNHQRNRRGSGQQESATHLPHRGLHGWAGGDQLLQPGRGTFGL